MTEDFYKGQTVQAIKNSRSKNPRIIAGNLYTVSEPQPGHEYMKVKTKSWDGDYYHKSKFIPFLSKTGEIKTNE